MDILLSDSNITQAFQLIQKESLCIFYNYTVTLPSLWLESIFSVSM
jgi:hypothetical protein